MSVLWSGLCCVDCAMLVANDVSDDEHRAKVARWCEENEQVLSRLVVDTDEGFRSVRCDVCGDDHAGDRWGVAELSR